MSDQRITQLTKLNQADVAANDVLPIVDIGSSITKKVEAKDLFQAGIALANNSSIDLAKLNQSSATKLGTVALADDAITAAKLASDSAIAYDSVTPTADNFRGRGYVNSTSKYLQVWNGTSFDQVVSPTAGIEDGAVSTAKLANGSVTIAKIDAAGLPADALAANAVTTGKILNGAVTTDKLSALSVTAAKIAPNAVDSAALANNSVITDAIVNGAVIETKLANNAVSTAKIQNGAVTNDKVASASIAYDKLNLANGSVPGEKIQANTVTSAQLALDAATTGAIANLAVTTGKLATGSVTAAKLGPLAVTAGKIAADAVTATEIANNSIETAAVVDFAVTEAKLATSAVTEEKLGTAAVTVTKVADASITYAKLNLADGSVPGGKIQANTVTSAQLATDAVTTGAIADLNVTTGKLANQAVTAGKIANNTITAAQIAAGAVGNPEIADAVVTYAKIQNTTNADVVLGRTTGAGVVQEIPLTAAGRALIDDVDAAAQRATLGLGDIAIGTGTWIDGSSFEGTSSGTNTGDQTITLTGDVTGTGTGTFETEIAAGAVTEAKIGTAAVTSGKINAAAVTAVKLADNSGVIVAADVPSGDGEFIGQQWVNTNTGFEYTWTGSVWQQLHGISTLTFTETTPLGFAVAYPDNFSAEITVNLDTQQANTIFAGPGSGGDAAPTFRALIPDDLPDATGSTKGIMQPGTGLAVADGTINHTNSVSGATISGVTFDNQGHITAATALVAADLPVLDTSKITTGTFGTAFIADDAVTATKLADYAIAQIGEALPVAEHIGQIFFNPLDKAFFLWDGNVWQSIGISAGAIIFGGTYDASTNFIASVTTEGAAIGLSVGENLPSASATNVNYYLVVATGGTGTAPAPTVVLAPPDLLLSNGSNWLEIDVSATFTAQTANNVAFSPAGLVGSTNVQAAIEEVSSECRNATNLTSGTLAVARGGTGIGSYTKGDLLAATGETTLAKLVAGANGQVLRANSATATGLEWGNDFVGTVTNVTSSTGALTVATGTTTPALTLRSATTSVNGIVQLTDSISTTSSVLAATATAVKSAYDLAAAALPKAGGTVTGQLLFGTTGTLVFEGTTNDAFKSTLAVADPTANRTITLPNATGTVALTSDLNDGTY